VEKKAQLLATYISKPTHPPFWFPIYILHIIDLTLRGRQGLLEIFTLLRRTEYFPAAQRLQRWYSNSANFPPSLAEDGKYSALSIRSCLAPDGIFSTFYIFESTVHQRRRTGSIAAGAGATLWSPSDKSWGRIAQGWLENNTGWGLVGVNKEYYYDHV
jgi:hypothetical protein